MELDFAAGTQQTRTNRQCKQTLKCPEAIILLLKFAATKRRLNFRLGHNSAFPRGRRFLIELVQTRLLYGLLLSTGITFSPFNIQS